MSRHNCMNVVPGNSPLIHEVHGEPYKVVKAVYMALPWLWSKLGMLMGALVNTMYVKATLTTTEQTQLIPYPPPVNMMNIRNSVLWAITKDGTRRYKYRNCHLTETGLLINIDLQAPENQKGIKVVWNIMLANKPWGKGPHGPGFFHTPFDCEDVVPPFHYRPVPPGPCFPPPNGYDGEYPSFPYDQP